jgi:hypothetical protein
MTGSLDQLVLIKASKSLGGVWSDDAYYVRDHARNVVVGVIRLHPQAPKDRPWFWTITARQIPASIHAQNNVPADKPESSTGRTLTPETKGQKQPQGWTAPVSAARYRRQRVP